MQHPGTPAPLNYRRPSTFPAACLGCVRTLLVLLAVLSAVLLAAGNARAQGTVATDRAAMVALYNATGGANWTNNTNWLTNEALSEWHGLDTDANGRVTGLRLENNGLIGEIPAELGDLTNLIALRLYSNSLSGEIPVELGGLANLEELSLRGNALTGEIPAELGDLTNLIALRLYSNSLSGEIPAALGELANLQELILSRNALTGEIPVELGGLTNLISLRLYSNRLSGEIPMELRGMANLQELDLNENMLTGEIPAALGELANLQVLSLWSNRLSGEIPVELGGLSNLQLLSLWGNALTGEIPAELGGLSQLRVLIISQNVLRGEISAELGGLANLEELNLWGNRLSGEIPVELGDLTNLQLLSFRGNALTGEIPAELGNLTNLEELSLNENTLIGRIPAELGDLTNLRVLSLWGNSLSGEIPAELGNLTNLEELSLSSNGLSGPLPLTLSALSQLSVLDIRSTTLCAPLDTAFQVWLATINFQGAVCVAPPPPPPPPPLQPPGPGPVRQTVPSAPRNLLAEGGDGQVKLTWEAPENDGGSEITDYEYRIDGRNLWISIGSTDTTHTVSGLVNGTVYVFEVRAVNRIGKSFSSNRAEATPEAPEVFTLDFAHFAKGTGITSEMVLVNVSPHPIRPAIYFYDRGGHLIDPASVVDVTVDLEVTEDGALSALTEMEPLGELTISTHGQGELVSGSVKVVSDGPLGGLVRYGVPNIGVAGVGASPPVRDALFPARRQAGGIRTAAALHNLGAEAVGVSCRLMSAGVALEEVEIPLEANGQTSWFIEEAFTTTDTSDFLGSVRCTAPGRGRFTAIAVEMDAAQRIFSTLSVVPVDRTGGGGGETVLDFAHFVNGTWITDLVFLNLETQPSRPAPTPFHTAILPSRPAIYFYDTEGNPIAAASVVDITGDLEITEDGALTVCTEMEPLGVLTISTHGRGALVSGSVRVVSEGPIGGMLRFEHPDLGVAGVGASPPVSDALFPVRRQAGGITTGVALHNLESSAGLVHCDLMREGVLLDGASIPLEANGQTAWLIDQAFPDTDTSDFAGSVRCSAPGGDLFTAVALEMDHGTRIFTTLPVVPVPERTDRE